MDIVEAIIRLNKVFKYNGWATKDTKETVFNRFCEFLNVIDERQRNLIIELVERYKWISESDYQSCLLDVLEKVEDLRLSRIKKIYLFPIIKPRDEGKIKSALPVIYLLKGYKDLLEKYTDIKFQVLSKFSELQSEKFKLKQNDLLFLFDDFIGSGETFKECIETILENPTISRDKICVISIASQEVAMKFINEIGISSFAHYVVKRGISDFYNPSESKEKKEIMLAIEKLFPGSSNVSLGYNESEALITLIRTPDNTFPVFWKRYRLAGKYYKSPFYRDESI